MGAFLLLVHQIINLILVLAALLDQLGQLRLVLLLLRLTLDQLLAKRVK